MSGCSAVGSAQRLGRWGRWFESSHPDHPFLLPVSATTNMDQPADLRAQATELRRQGFSYSQIGRRLGVHKSVIARWVAAVSFDGFNSESRAEQLSAVRDPHLYNRALELRQAGWSYKMIEAEIGVARSTLSGWLRHLRVAEYHPEVRQRRLQAQHAAVAANKRRQQALRRNVREEAAAEIRELLVNGVTDRELFMIGLTLYWAEGAKTHGHVCFANSLRSRARTDIRGMAPALPRDQP